jgi:hypothetical protein
MILKERYGSEINIFLRLLGAWRVNKDSIDFKWGYFSPRLGFEFVLHRGGYFDSRYAISFCFIFGLLNIKLPFKTKLKEGCNLPRYGISIHSNTFWFYTGGRYGEQLGQCIGNDQWIAWHLPFFSYEFDGHWIVNKDGKYVFIRKNVNSWDFRKKGAKIEIHPYTYILKDGTSQNRKATISQEKRKWHRKWFPFLKKENVSIDVEFDDEIGERIGSWKGGTVGCSYDMLPDESMLDTLKRMESERIFN